MPRAARLGDLIKGGDHCHGHDHGPKPSPGRIIQGSPKVRIDGRPAARVGDQGYSPVCCGKIGQIVIMDGAKKVRFDGIPVGMEGSLTQHCGMGAGMISGGSRKVQVS